MNYYFKILKIVKILIIALILVFPIKFFVIQSFQVYGVSMEPSFSNGDYLIIDKISYIFRKPSRGETIVFLSPSQKFIIKRVIGLPYETVQIKQGDIFVYNRKQDQWLKLHENYIPENIKTLPDLKIVLSEKEYFALGDNRAESIDSRSFGPVRLKNIIGKVFIRLMPVKKLNVY